MMLEFGDYGKLNKSEFCRATGLLSRSVTVALLIILSGSFYTFSRLESYSSSGYFNSGTITLIWGVVVTASGDYSIS